VGVREANLVACALFVPDMFGQMSDKGRKRADNIRPLTV
jgi:hypothetical protein